MQIWFCIWSANQVDIVYHVENIMMKENLLKIFFLNFFPSFTFFLTSFPSFFSTIVQAWRFEWVNICSMVIPLALNYHVFVTQCCLVGLLCKHVPVLKGFAKDYIFLADEVSNQKVRNLHDFTFSVSFNVMCQNYFLYACISVLKFIIQIADTWNCSKCFKMRWFGWFIVSLQSSVLKTFVLINPKFRIKI